MQRSQTYRTRALLAGIAMVLCVRSASGGIVVSPLKQEVTVKPGRTAKFYVSISNNARNEWDKPRSVHLEVVDFSVSEAGGLAFMPAGTVKNSTSKWITLGKSDLTLAPGEGQRVECTVKAPYSAAGEAYSAVMVTLQTKGKTKSGVTVGYRIASGVFVKVAGRTFPKQGKITRCETVWPKAPATSQPAATRPAQAPKVEPVKVLAVLKNTGRVRFKASGQLRISNAKGRILYRTPMTTKRARVLPGDTRLFEAVVNEALPQGRYTVKVELDYQSKWAKARRRLPLTISADQAALLAKAADQTKPAGAGETSGAMIEVTPKKLTEKIPPGGLRSLKVVVKNTGKDSVQCTAALAARPDPARLPARQVGAGGGEADTPIPASWVTLTPDRFTLPKRRSRTLSLIVRVPSTAAGRYKGTLIVHATGTGGMKSRWKVPIALTIGAGK